MAKKIDSGVRLRIAFRNIRFPATASAIEGRIGHGRQGRSATQINRRRAAGATAEVLDRYVK